MNSPFTKGSSSPYSFSGAVGLVFEVLWTRIAKQSTIGLPNDNSIRENWNRR